MTLVACASLCFNSVRKCATCKTEKNTLVQNYSGQKYRKTLGEVCTTLLFEDAHVSSKATKSITCVTECEKNKDDAGITFSYVGDIFAIDSVICTLLFLRRKPILIGSPWKPRSALTITNNEITRRYLTTEAVPDFL